MSPSDDLSRAGLQLRGSGADDGFLDYLEISRLPLDGAVVVLLGCDTAGARIDERAGRQAVSLAEAFLDAGSRSVVGNLWALNEAAARELAEEFYLAGGAEVGAAGLATAKRRLRARYPTRLSRWAGAVWEGAPTPAE